MDEALALIRSAGTSRSFNELEAAMASAPPVDLPLRHLFTPGLYTREIFIPKGTLTTTRVHRTTHPFVIMKGDVSVLVANTDGAEPFIVRYRAPFRGVTEPGTRRMLYAHEDTVWVAFHATDLTDPDKIGEAITEDPDNPLVDFNSDRTKGWTVRLAPSLFNHYPRKGLPSWSGQA